MASRCICGVGGEWCESRSQGKSIRHGHCNAETGQVCQQLSLFVAQIKGFGDNK